MDYYYSKFKFCPVCGKEYREQDKDIQNLLFVCSSCGYRYYQNMDPTVAAIIPKKGSLNKLLLTTRNMNPGKDRVDTPGGFLRYGELPVDGIRRELQEELAIEVNPVELFTIEITNYQYQEVSYLHTTIYYLMEEIDCVPIINDEQENQNVDFYDVLRLIKQPDKFAFNSDIEAIKKYILKL